MSTADMQEKKPKENGAVAEAASANAEDTEAWRHADPYAFLPNPAENNKVSAWVTFNACSNWYLQDLSACNSPHASLSERAVWLRRCTQL